MSDTFDTTVRLAIQRAFLDGRPTPAVASIAADLRASPAEVERAFERLAEGRVIVLAPRTHEILMSAPFAGRPSGFSVAVGEHVHYANCIWDALGIPAMLSRDGRYPNADIRSTCADCGLDLSIALRAGAVSADPAGAVAHFAVPAARWWADIAFT